MAHNILEGYTRVFVEEHEVERTSSFYQDLLDGTETQRFSYPEKHLTIATVRSPQLSILIVGGSEEHRAPFAATRLTVSVASLDLSIRLLLRLGATQLEVIQVTPKGRKTRVLHPDGMVVEYVENSLSELYQYSSSNE